MSCPDYWITRPSILWEQPTSFFPFTEADTRCTAAALNSFTRFGLYLGIVLALVGMEWRWLLLGPVFALFTMGAWFYMRDHGSVREGLDDYTPLRSIHAPLTDAPIIDGRDVDGEYVPDIIGISGRTNPTAPNPFMNVLLTEISDNPYRSPAANAQGREIRAQLDQYFETMFASDPGDVFQRTQNQRIWVTQPSTTIPNDQESFANWIGRIPGQTCKEGNQAACGVAHVTGAEILPWRSLLSDG